MRHSIAVITPSYCRLSRFLPKMPSSPIRHTASGMPPGSRIPTAPLREPLVLHFRRTLDLPAVPASYPVRVSADNRFILYVNGQRVGDGPARGDLTHWRYERFDLAPPQTGQNLITATVWNFGVYAPIAQMSDRTAFLLESEATGATRSARPRLAGRRRTRAKRPLDRYPVTHQDLLRLRPRRRNRRREIRLELEFAVNCRHELGASRHRRCATASFPANKAHSADTTGDNLWGLIPDELPHMEYAPTPARSRW